MAFLMFFTSAGFSIDLHYCQKQIKGISLIGKAKSCHAVQEKCPHHIQLSESNSATEKNNCCENETVQIQYDQDQKTPSELIELNFECPVFFTISITAFLLNDEKDEPLLAISLYRPPPLIRDISILYESFLI